MSKTKIMDNKTVGMIGRFLNENAPTLAIGGAIGTLVGALYAAFKASQEISSVKASYDEKVKSIESEGLSDDQKAVKLKDAKSERNTRYILTYKWVGLLGIASISLMIAANAMNGAKIATLTTLAVANQEKLKKLAENGRNMIGDVPWKEVENKTIDDIVSEKIFGEDGPKAKRIDKNNGKLFVDTNLESPYMILFQMKEEDLQDALTKAMDYYKKNSNTIDEHKYYDILGFPPAPAGSKYRVWGPNNPLIVRIGKTDCGGVIFPALEYENKPTTPGAAGVTKIEYYFNEKNKDEYEANPSEYMKKIREAKA